MLWILFMVIIFQDFRRLVDSASFGANMGWTDKFCDDGKTNLNVDWDYNPSAYTCMQPRKWSSMPNVESYYYAIPNFDPRRDKVYHYCMNTTLLYKENPPIRDNHRPLWAKYGEYIYLPSTRWLHNLEHGAIVMLFHPCADDIEVNKMRNLLVSCMYRHIITPYDRLTSERPLALLSWGAKFEVNTVYENQIVHFIKNHARRSPEDLSKQGQYEELLIRPAFMVSDINDTRVCPWAI